MGFFERKETTSLFPEGEKLTSQIWTGRDLIMGALNASAKDIMTVKLDREKLSKVEEEARTLRPILKIYSYNGYLCYLVKDERRVYDLVQTIEEQMARVEAYHPQLAPTKAMGLDKQIRSAETQTSDVPDYLKRMGLVEEGPADVPPTDIENRWAEEKLTEELKNIETEIQEAAALLVAGQQLAKEDGAESKSRKKRKSLGRTNRIQIRLTDSELTDFQRRVRKSGLSQGDFLRSAALNGQIIIEEHSPTEIVLLDELSLLRAEIGRQGGLLKMITKPNLGQRELKPEEWEQLMNAIRGLDNMKERISKMEEKVSGNSKTSIK